MKITWQIEEKDLELINKFKKKYRNNPFVQKRIERNIDKTSINISKDEFFKAMVSCLLTTQQRSGPNSSVTKFINTSPFPLNYRLCVNQTKLLESAQQVISNFGGLRRSNKIANEITTNLKFMEAGLWKEISMIMNDLLTSDSPIKEKEAAEFINNNFKGFGPKQSRNLLQSLGLTKYEIPIDSRITKWLNKLGFPVILSATALSDINYYNFVSDGFQMLCKEGNIKPCVLDAIIFVSFDRDEWTDKNVVW
jgi:thermostable 8-oxoguanine DNA glycosylase